MKVLVVVDMQNDFITGPLGTPEAQAIVPKVCELIEQDYDDVCYTMDTHDELYLDSHEGKILPVEHCIFQTKGWYVEPHVWAALEKRTDRYFHLQQHIKVDRFGSTTLAETYKGIAEFERLSFDICGVCTDICVISNALMLRTHYPYSNIRVIASACAGTTPEMHQKALDVMRSCHIEVVE